MDITYREAEPGDARALLDYLKTVGGETDNMSFGAAGISFTVEQEEAHLLKLKSSHSMSLLALDGGEIVGNAVLNGNTTPRFAHRGSLGITVRKDHWGQGIGTALLERVIAYARESGAEIVSLEVRSDNDRAKALYRKFGFEAFGTYPKFFKIGGQYFDVDFMILHL